MREDVLAGLSLEAPVEEHLAELVGVLDAAWKQMAERLEEAGADAKVSIEVQPNGRAKLNVDALGALGVPKSLAWLRRRVEKMLPKIDLPDLLFEVHSWTGFLDAFVHLGDGKTRMKDLTTSVVALLVSEACNIGMTPVTNPGLKKVTTQWEDMLKVAGSLVTNQVRAYDLLRMFGNHGRPTPLGQAFAEYGRIAKTLHLLQVVDPVDDTYRRQMGKQLSVQESRHTLARDICHGKRGTIHQAYRDGMEDQLGSLGLVLNAVVLWTTKYIDAAVAQLRAEGHEISDEDVARLSPLKFKNLNVLGRYSFTPSTPRQGLRPLRGRTLPSSTMTKTGTSGPPRHRTRQLLAVLRLGWEQGEANASALQVEAERRVMNEPDDMALRTRL